MIPGPLSRRFLSIEDVAPCFHPRVKMIQHVIVDEILSKINQKGIRNASYPAGIYLFKVNNRNTRTRCEICSKLTINTPERRQWRRSGVFIVNFEHISHLALVFLLLILNK